MIAARHYESGFKRNVLRGRNWRALRGLGQGPGEPGTAIQLGGGFFTYPGSTVVMSGTQSWDCATPGGMPADVAVACKQAGIVPTSDVSPKLLALAKGGSVYCQVPGPGCYTVPTQQTTSTTLPGTPSTLPLILGGTSTTLPGTPSTLPLILGGALVVGALFWMAR